MRKLRVGDLFAGIGGMSLGLERTGGFKTAFFCEYAAFPQKVLRKHWPDVPIYSDICDLTAERLDADGIGRIDILTGGYPCQPFSHAGKRLGAEDDRHLWPEMCRLVKSLRPAWVIGENVAGHVSMGLDDVLSDLDGLGYAAQAFVIPACAVNAPHRRDRTWVIANCQSISGHGEYNGRSKATNGARGFRVEVGTGGGKMADADSDDAQRFLHEFFDEEKWSGSLIRSSGPCGDGFRWWTSEPAVGRVAHGVPHRVDRLKALGNAVVPQIPEMIGRAILRSMEDSQEQAA
jgi:DNA (cytosine-5)-methyltransferase 1